MIRVLLLVIFVSAESFAEHSAQCSCKCGRRPGSEYWTKLNGAHPVCFTTTNSGFGTFAPAVDGFAAAFKLVHRSGKIRFGDHLSYQSYWGIVNYGPLAKIPLNVVLTDDRNQLIVPASGNSHVGLWYNVPGFNPHSPYLIMQKSFTSPYLIKPDSHLRVWAGEDLKKWANGNNHGTACIDVYGHLI